jgi:pimeloyl-ACP methyl ester carboxylesterase
MTATAVLVHGAWHGAWCFERVVPLLQSAGIDTVAIDLPGHGDDPGPLSDLHGDAARVREALDRIDGECVLLGHSYGGAVITEAGVHPSVRHLVYLCAFAIDAEESCMAAAISLSAQLDISFQGDGPSLADAIVAQPDGTSTVDPDVAAACFYNDCDAETARAAIARLGAQPGGTLGDVPTAVAWRERPSTYVVCTEDLAVPPALQRAMAARCSASVDWPTSHSPFLSAPERVADLVTALALA